MPGGVYDPLSHDDDQRRPGRIQFSQVRFDLSKKFLKGGERTHPRHVVFCLRRLQPRGESASAAAVIRIIKIPKVSVTFIPFLAGTT